MHEVPCEVAQSATLLAAVGCHWRRNFEKSYALGFLALQSFIAPIRIEPGIAVSRHQNEIDGHSSRCDLRGTPAWCLALRILRLSPLKMGS